MSGQNFVTLFLKLVDRNDKVTNTIKLDQTFKMGDRVYDIYARILLFRDVSSDILDKLDNIDLRADYDNYPIVITNDQGKSLDPLFPVENLDHKTIYVGFSQNDHDEMISEKAYEMAKLNYSTLREDESEDESEDDVVYWDDMDMDPNVLDIERFIYETFDY